MMFKKAYLLTCLSALLLSACGDDHAEAVGGVTEGEARALNEAAEMLDSRALPPVAANNMSDNSHSKSED